MTSSYNGWTASKNPDAIGVVPLVVMGVKFPAGVKGGDVHTVLGYVAEQFFKRVEKPLPNGLGCWGFNYRKNRNSNNMSCHASATAIDVHATKHPNKASGTFTRKQVTEIREILAEVDQVVRWGGDFNGSKDEMHFEINGNAAEVKKVANKIRAAKAGLSKQSVAKARVPQPADPRLHIGNIGPRVKDIQRALIKHGYKVIEDGDFGPGTDRALRAFQKANKLNPDGITWAGTWAALRKAPRAKK